MMYSLAYFITLFRFYSFFNGVVISTLYSVLLHHSDFDWTELMYDPCLIWRLWEINMDGWNLEIGLIVLLYIVFELCWVNMSYLTVDLSSSRVKDTVSHTSTPAFSVDGELLRYLPGHADAFQILLYGVYPVLSWSSRLSFCTAYILV